MAHGSPWLIASMCCHQHSAAEQVRTAFEGSISEAFEDALRHYVVQEEKELMEYVATCIQVRWPGVQSGVIRMYRVKEYVATCI